MDSHAFLPQVASYCHPPTYPSCVAGIIDMSHHTWLTDWGGILLAFYLGWSLTMIFLISTSWVTGIIYGITTPSLLVEMEHTSPPQLASSHRSPDLLPSSCDYRRIPLYLVFCGFFWTKIKVSLFVFVTVMQESLIYSGFNFFFFFFLWYQGLNPQPWTCYATPLQFKLYTQPQGPAIC
jgi:hypothetical protein